jgi:glycosyltransferase involved in cell wall biosynthesis
MTAARLRVMVFLHSFEPGGVERVALRLCGALAPMVDVQLVMGRTEGVMATEAPEGLPLHVIGSGRFPTAGWETLWMIIVLARQIRAQRPDVLFAAGNSYAVVAVAMKLLFGRACPPIVLKISNDLGRADLPAPVRALYRLWCRVQGRLIDHFTGLAPPMAAEIAAAMRVPPARITIIDDPALGEADHARLAAIGAARGQPAPARRYVAIGRLAAQKNFARAIAAFALAARPGDTLAIIGEGGKRARLERQVAALGLSGQVRLPGHGDAVAALAAADVYLLSSDYEALPAVVVEALASGLPVVATDCCVSIRDLVGGFGTVVPPGDTAALAAAMRAQPLPGAATRTAMAAAMQRFTITPGARAYAALFAAMA